jgi:glycosyltransferase involved in cell wall biosynthesis
VTSQADEAAPARADCPRQIRVLIVTNMWPRPDRPGFGTFVESQVRSLAGMNVETEVAVIRGDRSALAYARAIQAVRRAVERWQPDLVHAHFGLAGWSARLQPVPLVLSVCGDDLLGAVNAHGSFTIKSRVTMAMTRAAVQRAVAVICKSPNLLAALPEAAKSRAVVIPNGVDLGRFHPGDRAAARAAVGLDPAAEYVLFPHDHRQPLQKRFALAAEVMQALQALRPQARLLQVSGEPAERMPDYYRAANCMLLTSRSEGSPNTVKEALACDVPVVSVDVGDVAHWLRRCRNCRLVSADVPDLSAALADVLARDQPAGSAAVLAELDLASVARRIRAVYDRVLEAA